jgi:hypothetical protein
VAGLVVACIAWHFAGGASPALSRCCAIAWSGFWSIPRNAEWLRGSLEDRHAIESEAQLPHADAIVVLGGGGYTWISRPA